mmetsp:Transcript_6862/g.27972  ORF Transcript_6862/g.27972 Transcript_6862/m.27972 type:complete len:210 (-) Transcript_6862:106-735(-)
MSTPVFRSPIAPHARAIARFHSPGTARPAAGPHRRPKGAAFVVVTRAAAASKGADTTGKKSTGKKGKTNVTDMYVALREMERAAEEAETECVLNASNSSEQSKCTERYLEAAETIEAAKLAALASGTGAQEERLIAKAAVKKARADRISELATAAEDELDCVSRGGGAECTVAFNNAWDKAEEREREAVMRHRSLLRRWVNQHKGSGSR